MKNIKKFEEMNEEWFLKGSKVKDPIRELTVELEDILSPLPIDYDDIYFSITKLIKKMNTEKASRKEIIDFLIIESEKIIKFIDERSYTSDIEIDAKENLLNFISKLRVEEHIHEQKVENFDTFTTPNKITIKSTYNELFYIDIIFDNKGRVDKIINKWHVNMPQWRGLNVSKNDILQWMKKEDPRFYFAD